MSRRKRSIKYLALLATLVVACPVYPQLNMTLHANWSRSHVNSYNDVWGYVDTEGNEYAIIGSNAYIFVLDVSDPSNPVVIDSIAGGQSTSWRDMKTYENFLYGISDNVSEGMLICDLGDLPNGGITKIYQKTSNFLRAHNIFIDGPNGRLYVAGSNSRSNGLIVFDIQTDPSNPILLSSLDLDGDYVHDVFVRDNIAYCSSAYEGLYLIDYSDPSDPQTIASFGTGNYNHSGWLVNDSTYIFAEEIPWGRPLYLLDISDAESDNLDPITTIKDPLLSPLLNNVYHNPYILGDYAYVSSYEDGVVIFDLSDFSDIDIAAYYDTYSNAFYSGYQGCWGVYPFLPSGTILASDISNGLFVLSADVPRPDICSNGIQDEFELGVDCGGFCKPCEIICPVDIQLSEPHSGGDYTYMTTTSITSVSHLSGSASITYQTGGSIQLNPGFSVEQGSTFQGIIDECSHGSTPLIPKDRQSSVRK